VAAGSGVIPVGAGLPLRLALVDADHAERPLELPQVAGARRGYDQGPAGDEDAAGLGGVARPEDAAQIGGSGASFAYVSSPGAMPLSGTSGVAPAAIHQRAEGSCPVGLAAGVRQLCGRFQGWSWMRCLSLAGTGVGR
jgi:hypothetical protein